MILFTYTKHMKLIITSIILLIQSSINLWTSSFRKKGVISCMILSLSPMHMLFGTIKSSSSSTIRKGGGTLTWPKLRLHYKTTSLPLPPLPQEKKYLRHYLFCNAPRNFEPAYTTTHHHSPAILYHWYWIENVTFLQIIIIKCRWLKMILHFLFFLQKVLINNYGLNNTRYLWRTVQWISCNQNHSQNSCNDHKKLIWNSRQI